VIKIEQIKVALRKNLITGRYDCFNKSDELITHLTSGVVFNLIDGKQIINGRIEHNGNDYYWASDSGGLKKDLHDSITGYINYIYWKGGIIMICNAYNAYYKLKTETPSTKINEVIKLEILNNFCDYHSLEITEIESWEVIEKTLNTQCNGLIKEMEQFIQDSTANYHGDYYNEPLDKELAQDFESKWDDVMWELGNVDWSSDTRQIKS